MDSKLVGVGVLLGLSGGLAWSQACGTSWVAGPAPHVFREVRQRRRAGWPDTVCRPHAQYVVPVVFHVVHGGGPDSLPLSVIQDQMVRLFEDYRRIPGRFGFTPKGADMAVEFSLATIDPSGQPTTGVVYWRWDAPPLSWSSPGLCFPDEAAMKAATGWPRDQYLNIWVVPAICGFSGDCSDCSGIAGYAYYPTIGLSDLYGSVVATPFIGGQLTGRGGRTLVHELGHNLGLAHPFEGGCGTADCATSGDEVCDTPPTAQENFSVIRQNTCNTDFPDLPDEARNYMDYVDDASMSHFTAGQRERAESFLLWNDPNSSLWMLHQPANLQVTGTGPYGRPRAAFWAEARRVLVGKPVRFYAVTAGQPHLFQWDFGGGVPDDPASPCPEVTFPAPGDYSVRLMVENLSGRRDTFTQAAAVSVEDTVWPLPLRESWEGPTFPPPGFSIENLDAGQGGSRTWERWRWYNGPLAGAYGQSMYTARLAFFQYGRYGERDYLVTPALDLRVDSAYHVQLRFAVSYACLEWGSATSYPLEYTDTLWVWASPDGGSHWELLYEKGGRALSTYPGGCIVRSGSLSGATHLPDPASWRTDTVSLDAYRGVRGLRLRFEGGSGWGNNLYLDSLVVDTVRDTTRSVTALAAGVPFSLRGGLGGAWVELAHPQVLSWKLYTAAGQEVARDRVWLGPGRHALQLPTLSAGFYFLQVFSEEGNQAFLRLWMGESSP